MDRFWLEFVWMPISWRKFFFIKLYMTWNVTFMLCSSFEIFFTIRTFDLFTFLWTTFFLIFLTIAILENLHQFRTIMFNKPKYVLYHISFLWDYMRSKICASLSVNINYVYCITTYIYVNELFYDLTIALIYNNW